MEEVEEEEVEEEEGTGVRRAEEWRRKSRRGRGGRGVEEGKGTSMR